MEQLSDEQSQTRRFAIAVIVIAGIICGHFLISVIAWTVDIATGLPRAWSIPLDKHPWPDYLPRIYRNIATEAGRCLLLFVAAILTLVAAARKRLRLAVPLLAAVIIVSIALCWYDISHHRYQSVTMHISPKLPDNEYYCTWWWY